MSFGGTPPPPPPPGQAPWAPDPPPGPEQPRSQSPWYGTLPFLVPMLICCAPVGIIFMWVAAPWTKQAKWAITGVLTTLMVATMVIGALAPPPEEDVSTSGPTTTGEVINPTTTAPEAPVTEPPATEPPATTAPPTTPPPPPPAPPSIAPSVEEFLSRWNAVAAESGGLVALPPFSVEGGPAMDTATSSPTSGGLSVLLTINKEDRSVREATIIALPENQSQAADALLSLAYLVRTASPDLPPDAPGDVLRDLGLTDAALDLSDYEETTTRGNVRYIVQASDVLGLFFIASPTALADAGESPLEGSSDSLRSLMPDVVCMNLQDAQDRIQEEGVFYSRSSDATGRGRSQIIDSNWIVVGQEPQPGEPIGEGDAVLSVVKNNEDNPC